MGSSWAVALGAGALIGLGSSILLLFPGKIAGISGIVEGLTSPGKGDLLWRALFIAGLLGGGALMLWLRPSSFQAHPQQSLAVVSLAGLLVGAGARLGGGCTSGHGVCGISHLSARSLIATLTFIATGALTVFVMRHLFRVAS